MYPTFKPLLLILPFLLVFGFSCADSNKQSQHHWTKSNAGGGGAISEVGATPSGVILAASDLSGVYRSADKGKSWDVLGEKQGLLDTHVSSLGFHTKDSNIFLMGTAHGLFKTKDGGKTIYQAKLETHSPSTPKKKPDGYIESIAMAFSKPSIGYLAHYENWLPELTFMKTVDSGDSWKIIKTKGIPKKAVVVKIVVDYHDTDLIYALTGKARFKCGPAQLYKSKDGGKSWQQLAKKLGHILDIDIHPTDKKKIYISTFHANTCGADGSEYMGEGRDFSDYVVDADIPGSLFVSNNAGLSFSKLVDKTGIISVSTKNPKTIRLVDILNPYDWNDNAGTWESKNSGKTWSHTGKVSDWSVGYSGNQYFTFVPTFHGLNKTVRKDLFNSDNFYASFGQWAWGSFDAGKHLNNLSTKKVAKNQWISTGVENINGHALDINTNPEIIYVGGYDIGFWYSKNHGKTWTRSLPDYNKYAKFSWDVGKVPVKPYAAIRGGGSNINTIISDPKQEATVWATFSRAQFGGETALFKSTEYGENWKLVGKGLPTGSKSVRMYGLSLDEHSPVGKRILYMTVNGDVYKSKDSGENWKKLLSKNKSGGLKFTQIDKFNSNLIFAGGEGGLWRSPDAGKHWKAIGGKYLAEMKNSQSKSREDIVPTFNEGSLKPWEGVFDIKTDPNKKFRVYVTAYGKGKGLYRSDNAGQSFTKLITDDYMRGVAIAPNNSDIVYATSSSSYHSGGKANDSLGIIFTSDGGKKWQKANANMSWKFGGMISIEKAKNPNVWAWSPGTGIQYSPIPNTN